MPKTMPNVSMLDVLLAASAVLLLSAGGHAEAKSLRAKLKPYCTSDYLRLCGPFATSRASIVSCFKRNVSSVSPRCRRAIERNTEFDPDRIERRRS
ncbi:MULTISPECIES: 3',5'-cyclic-nucleotide phosphodiesterase [unclassified Methylobacterium]|uniref:3',5'-cyclic-nucleotide phosphodiesterase n=1 Tax=unclassified Methylobacterium TaxID=2615210 RepID=UPI0011C1D764|nr:MULTISPECIES: 3',5'-cyclic-nucleotide phosphodiesterase [unclassified Methylobacterium]QEE39174.1 3',5'-cyclic-nucleotide phosphodiesterase [Methylobacterium sp. WL1]TXN56036.1 3',5'-cyclic-nucleotide phosphodiesterase [Methylobacterium sp. WL2]